MANQVDYRDPTPNNFPQDYDPAKVDSRVKLRSESIKHKQKGKHTREAMYQALEIGAVTAGEAKTTALDTANRQDESEKKVQNTSDNVNNVLAEITKNSGDTAAPEVIAARKPSDKPTFNSLGERLDNMPFNESVEIDDTYNDVDGGIRNYFVYQLKQISGAVDKSKFNLGFGTDYHYDVASNYLPYPLPEGKTMADATQGYKDGLRKLLNITSISDKLDAIVINGDNVDQPIADGGAKFEKAVMLKEHRDFANVAYQTSVAPIFVLKGNHDCNYNQEEITLDAVITDKELDNIYQFKRAKFGEIRKGSSNYFYKDFVDKKVRLIGLDTYDLPESETDGVMDYNRFTTSGLSQSQLNWLANDALQVDSDTIVLIITHHPINHTLFNYDDDLNLNHDLLQTILDDFKNGVEEKTINSSGRLTAEVTYSFKNKGHIAGVLTGHRHIDSEKIIGGINYIETRCSLTTGDNMIKSERLLMQGTINEDCFDLVTIDSDAKTINLTRFGIGTSRQLNFE